LKAASGPRIRTSDPCVVATSASAHRRVRRRGLLAGVASDERGQRPETANQSRSNEGTHPLRRHHHRSTKSTHRHGFVRDFWTAFPAVSEAFSPLACPEAPLRQGIFEAILSVYVHHAVYPLTDTRGGRPSLAAQRKPRNPNAGSLGSFLSLLSPLPDRQPHPSATGVECGVAVRSVQRGKPASVRSVFNSALSPTRPACFRRPLIVLIGQSF
jgi:hypothetical protein